jgi:hypothetical protein
MRGWSRVAAGAPGHDAPCIASVVPLACQLTMMS